MQSDSDGGGEKFILAEYHEAANAYFKGVDIGYATVKSYITLNGLFAALIGALADPKADAMKAAAEMIKLVPAFAIIASVTLLLALPHYFRHLENCRRRCEEIEASYGGQLFTRLGKIARKQDGRGVSARARITTIFGLLVIILSVTMFWGYFWIKLRDPNFTIQSIFKYAYEYFLS